jgi:hypothetical protein
MAVKRYSGTAWVTEAGGVAAPDLTAYSTTAQMNTAIDASKKILQIVSGSTGTETSNSTTTYADTTLTATITPQSETSQILVYVSHPNNFKSNGNSGNGMALRILRGVTSIYEFNRYLGLTNTATELYFSANAIYLDSPATTSATTYKTQFKNEVGASLVRVQAGVVSSQIILMEIGA